jgi:hypothetical protein
MKVFHASQRCAWDDPDNVLSDGASIRYGEGDGKTDKMQRIFCEGVMDKLLSEYPEKVNVQEDGDDHRSAGHFPIHRACEHANIHALTSILRTPGVAIEARKNNGCTALHTAIHAYGQGSVKNPMAGSVITPDEWEQRCMRNFQALLDAGADVSACHSSRNGESGFDPLLACVTHTYSRPDACLPLLKALIQRGALLNSRHRGTGGATALLWALQKGHFRCLEVLLLAGSDPTIEGQMGEEHLGGLGYTSLAKLMPRLIYDTPDDSGSVVARVAAVVLDISGRSRTTTTTSSRGSGARDGSALLRCSAGLRWRAALTEQIRHGRFSDAHRAHAVRAMQTATEFINSNMHLEARVAYTDALLWGVLGRSATIECLNNLTACFTVAGTDGCGEDLYVAKQLADELCERFPNSATSWCQMAKVLYELEHDPKLVTERMEEEGLTSDASFAAREKTRSALEECLHKARTAPDAMDHAEQLDVLERAVGRAELTEQMARAEELYMQAMKVQMGRRIPSQLALAIDLHAQSMQVGGLLLGPRVNSASSKLELATSLASALRGSDNLISLAESASVSPGSELRVTTLMSVLAARMPTSACRWMASAATLSRSWRAATILALHLQCLDELADLASHVVSDDPSLPSTALDLVIQFNHVTALASLGRFEEARAVGRKVWAARIAVEADRTTEFDDDKSAVPKPGVTPHESWDSWANKLSSSIRHGGRLMGLGTCSYHADGTYQMDAPSVQAAIDSIRADICAALIAHAEEQCTRGARPRTLSRLMESARSVGAPFEVPPAVDRAISGWAGRRAEELDSNELDDLWDSMLRNARRGADAAKRTEAEVDLEAIRSSFLPRGLAQEGDGAQPAQAASRRGKAKNKKKKGRGKGLASRGEALEEELKEEEEEEGPAAKATPTAPATATAAVVVGATSSTELSETEECAICFAVIQSADGERTCAPCSGRHALCRGCWVGWRAETLNQGTEFSCPMCRESLEGWEP